MLSSRISGFVRCPDSTEDAFSKWNSLLGMILFYQLLNNKDAFGINSRYQHEAPASEYLESTRSRFVLV
jgi:hypothetical protein